MLLIRKKHNKHNKHRQEKEQGIIDLIGGLLIRTG